MWYFVDVIPWELSVHFMPVKKLKLLKLDWSILSVLCIERSNVTVCDSVSRSFLAAYPFRFRKITTDPHVLADVNIECLDERCPKLKIYFSELIFKKPRIHNSSIRNNTLHYLIYDIFLTAIGLTPGGGSTVHIYTQTIHRTTQLTTRTTQLTADHHN